MVHGLVGSVSVPIGVTSDVTTDEAPFIDNYFKTKVGYLSCERGGVWKPMFSLDVHNQEGSSSSRSRPDAHGSRGAQGGWKTPSPASSYWLLQGGVQALHALPLVPFDHIRTNHSGVGPFRALRPTHQ